MCLLVMAYRAYPDYPLIVAANRDEFYRRATAPADFWADYADVLAGRDLEQGGTWMGVTRGGKFAALTNVRDPSHFRNTAKSRGQIVADYLTGQADIDIYSKHIAQHSDGYNGFNFIGGTVQQLLSFSTVDAQVKPLAQGIYGLSNHMLDTDWPKVQRSKQTMGSILSSTTNLEADLFAMLSDKTPADDARLPDTGVGIEKERWLSSIFIQVQGYGTRCSSLLMIDHVGNAQFVERTFSVSGDPAETRRFRFAFQ